MLCFLKTLLQKKFKKLILLPAPDSKLHLIISLLCIFQQTDNSAYFRFFIFNMSWTNYHSHCHFSDGTDEPRVYAETAAALGMPVYGFSCHVPMPFFCAWSMKMEKLAEYTEQVQALKAEFNGRLQIYRSLEIDYIPNVVGPKSKFIQDVKLDYTIGSVHFVDQFADGKHWEIDGTSMIFDEGLQQIFGGDIRKAVTRYYELTRMMVVQECPDIIGHIDKIKMQNEGNKYFSEEEEWYKTEVLKTLDVIANTAAIIEVNTRGLYKKKTVEPYPGKWMLTEILKRKIPVMINSDCHHPKEITAEFSVAAALLKDIGFKTLRVFYDNQWKDVAFTENGIVTLSTANVRGTFERARDESEKS